VDKREGYAQGMLKRKFMHSFPQKHFEESTGGCGRIDGKKTD
jgi:hypothetical protein